MNKELEMEMDTMKHAEESEDLKKKMLRQTAESEDQIEAAQARAHATEKQKHKIQMDIDALNKELEIANNNTLSADRRIKELEKQISDWRIKLDESLAEIDVAKSETKSAQAEVARLKSAKQEADDANETLKKDNRKLAEETIDLRDELEELNRNLMGADATIKKQEEEKAELDGKLDELDEALHMEEEKVVKAGQDMTLYKQEVERQLAEKDAEIEKMKRKMRPCTWRRKRW